MRSLQMSILALAALLAAASLSGQEQQDEPPPFFLDSIDVSVVNLDVFVTDDRGEPIRGLGREDFELYEDGRQVPITNFYAVESRSRSHLEIPEEEMARGIAEGLDALEVLDAPTPEEQRLHLVLYIDNENVNPLYRNKLFHHLRTFLFDTVRDGDRVALYTFDKTLKQRLPFTERIDEVTEQLLEIEQVVGGRRSQERARADLLRDIERAQSPTQVSGRMHLYAENLAFEANQAIDALKESVQSLAGLPGRKAIVYVSDGLPARPGEDIYRAYADRFNDPSAITEVLSLSTTRAFDQLTSLANANGVTFYTIEAAGLRGYAGGGADSQSGSAHVGLTMDHRRNVQEPLKSMAVETGGQAIVGTSNFAPLLQRVVRDFSSYYSLGYTPALSGDGRYRDLEVKVKRPDVKVRHRRGYRAKSATTWMRERTEAAAAYDTGSNPFDLVVTLSPPASDDGDTVLLPLTVRVPLARITLIPQETVHLGRLKVFLSTVDDQGRRATIEDVPWSIEIPSDEVERAVEGTWAFDTTLRMRPGTARIAVGVRDEIGAASSFTTTSVHIPEI